MVLTPGRFGTFLMPISASCKLAVVLLVLLCWSPLFSRAQNNTTVAITDPVEVESLQDVRKSLVDVNNNLSNWKEGDPCTAKWNGVLCFNSTNDDGYLHVRELQLLNMNLSGTLSPSLGNFSYMEILDFMWNKISGSIPKEIGNIKSLKLLLLNGNQLTGRLPDELGYLPVLDRIQIDQNQISGPLPASFANLNKTKHFHMNNNSISGQIPKELSRLPSLVHFLLDNNNLTGHIPIEFAQLPNILIIQLDNNNFQGTTIPQSFGNISTLLKLSLRNCSLEGSMPDFSGIPNLGYLDLSRNQLSGPIPRDKLSENITTIDLSYNHLNGTIPANFSGLPRLQKLSLANNSLNGSVSSTIWEDRTLNSSERLTLDFSYNNLSDVSGSFTLPQNVSIWLQGNPACSNSSLDQLCGTPNEDANNQNSTSSTPSCDVASCPPPYEYNPASSTSCYCAAPLLIGYRLKSPGFTNFIPYKVVFEEYLTSGLELNFSQLDLYSFMWEEGPRLKMDLKLFPLFDPSLNNHMFNTSEVERILGMFTGWNIPDSEIFGPYELINIDLVGPYQTLINTGSSSSGLSNSAIAGIVIGSIAGAVVLSAVVSLVILRGRLREHRAVSKKRSQTKSLVRIEGIKDFTYAELALATNNFASSSQIGQGGYGRVYKGVLANGTMVAIKRAQEGSLQGEKEFLTEIELLSPLHHRNLVALVGYCDEEGEQMLVYEFMVNGTLRDHISVRTKFAEPLSFSRRVRIALGSAKGILYLHTEADPPIFHRDIKASNILLDANLNAKVADFGLSRLAPVPDMEGTTPEHVSTVVKGTPGYLDPEYFLTHKLTDKSDVYSLGVVFLELLTGMQPISHGKNIVREVNVAYQSGMIFSVIDSRMGSYPSDCVEKFLNLALRCCADEPDARPSMAEVVRELENIWLMMPESDTKFKDSVAAGPDKDFTSPSSSSATDKNPYVSTDVSGSNLVSGVVPTITPR